MANHKLDVALSSGPMYDPLYERIPAFEQSSGIRVQVGYSAPHPELNAHLAALADPPYDLVSTHTKYAPSQLHFLAPLDDCASSLDLGAFYHSLLHLAPSTDACSAFCSNSPRWRRTAISGIGPPRHEQLRRPLGARLTPRLIRDRSRSARTYSLALRRSPSTAPAKAP